MPNRLIHMKLLNKILYPFQTALRKSITSFVRLETMDSEFTLAASDGSLVTYLKIDGSRQVIGEEEYNYLVDAATIKLGANLTVLVMPCKFISRAIPTKFVHSLKY